MTTPTRELPPKPPRPAGWSITQRQATLAVLGLQLVGIVVGFVALLVLPDAYRSLILPAGLAALITAALLIAYWRGWEYARYAAVIFITLLVPAILTEPFLTERADISVLFPPVLALVLASPAWVLFSIVAELALLLVRAGGQGIYAHPITLIIIGLIVAGLILSRLIVETSLRQAQAARREAEARARELAEKSAALRFQAHLLDAVGQAVVAGDRDGNIIYWNRAAEQLFGWSSADALGRAAREFLAPAAAVDAIQVFEQLGRGQSWSGEALVQRRDGTPMPILASSSPILDEHGQVSGFIAVVTDITELKHAEAALQLSEDILKRVNALVLVGDSRGLITYVGPSIKAMLGYEPAEVLGEGWLQLTRADPVERAHVRDYLAQAARREGPLSAEPYENVVLDRAGKPHWVLWSDAYGPSGQVVGVGHDITARKEAEAQIERQFRRLQALREIDTAIASSLDLRVTLAILLQQVTAQIGADAADVLLLEAGTHRLTYAAGRGFRKLTHAAPPQRLGEGHAGRAALERRLVHVPNLRAAVGADAAWARSAVDEGFVSYFGAPLIAKGELRGVLEVFHRTAVALDGEWLDFLPTLAGQAAIAIDNAQLFDTLQRTNAELRVSYDATIEGWARALDLRDKETEGHSQRVTQLAERLARRMGLNERELIHLRRGALLHDVGKLGVPDHILLKPGPLSDEEWVIMKQHPIYAQEMLWPIDFLRPALDIPYCHHEKWDGSGYPRKLKGDEIPLAARIFAVVDVWDALRSDRPYRPAWPFAQARDYIRQQSGAHFDPRVVDAFLRLDLDAELDQR